MKRFEYRVERTGLMGIPLITLDNLGLEGWELVSVTRSNDLLINKVTGYIYYFKKEIQE